MQVAEQACPLLKRRGPANRMREYRNNRAHEEIVVVGALLTMRNHRLPKRVTSGELENAGKRGPKAKEKNGRTV